jgi:hypothetical protein
MKGGRIELPQQWRQSGYEEAERAAREEAERAAREEALELERQRLRQVWLDHEERVRQSAVNATHAFNEYRANQNRSSCSILGGRIKNTFRKKNKSKRGNKRLKKNKRYSRKYSSKSSSKSLKK